MTGLQSKSKELIINTLLKLKASGLQEGTLRNISYSLAKLDKLADLSQPEQVKLAIANMNVEDSYKANLVKAYDYYTAINNIDWVRPKYRVREKIPLIPTTENVNKIISACTEKYATIYTILAETGLEAHELATVERRDIDAGQGIISVRGCKGHASGTYKIKLATAEMLRVYLYKHNSERPFPESRFMSSIWTRTRNRLAQKLQDPQIKQIQMRHLRNYSGAQLYYKTQDPIAVMRHLRHKKLETTMHYLRGITTGGEEEYTCKTATTPEEAKTLIELGFQKIDEFDGIHLYRKRK